MDAAAFDDARDYSLAAVFHEFAEAGGEGVHFVTGGAGFDEEENRFADLDLLADERDQVDAGGFDVGADLAGIEIGAEGSGVLGDHFALDQADLAFGGFAVVDAAEIAFVFGDSFFGDEIEFGNFDERFASDAGMDVERGDDALRGAGRKLIFQDIFRFIFRHTSFVFRKGGLFFRFVGSFFLIFLPRRHGRTREESAQMK